MGVLLWAEGAGAATSGVSAVSANGALSANGATASLSALPMPGAMVGPLSVSPRPAAGPGFGSAGQARRAALLENSDRGAARLAIRLAAPGETPAQEPPPQGQEPEPLPLQAPESLPLRARFLGQRDDDEILAHICQVPVASFKPLGGGASISLKVLFADGERAALKPMQRRVTRYQAEVASYRVARALHMPVAPSCVRLFPRAQLMAGMPRALQARMDAEMLDNGHGMVPCAMIHWIRELHGLHLEKQTWWQPLLRRGEPLPPDRRRRLMEISTQMLFDFLIVNDDRWSGGNTNEAGNQLVFLDQGAGFGNDRHGKRQRMWKQLRFCQRFDRQAAAALRDLDVVALKRELRGLLSAEELVQLGERVKMARDYLAQLQREAPDDSLL